MGGLGSAAAAVAPTTTTAARLVADAYMATVADVAAAAAAAGPVRCMDFISRDIYATFAVELVWTLPYQFV